MTTTLVDRPAVLRSIPLGRSTIIEASAGTGKTFTLEHLVVELLLAGGLSMRELLVVTFTEKATHELRSRVRAKLQELLSGDAVSADFETARGDVWRIDAGAREKLAAALHAFDAATITTIHAFCQGVLREHAFEGGRLFDEEQVEAREAFGRAFREVLRKDLALDAERSPWLEVALEHGFSPVRLEDLLWRSAQARGDIRPEFDSARLAAALQATSCSALRAPNLAGELKRAGMASQSASGVASRLLRLADLIETTEPRSGRPLSLPRFVARAGASGLDWIVLRLENIALRPGILGDVCAAVVEIARSTPPFQAALASQFLPTVVRSLSRSKREAGRFDFDDMLGLVDSALAGRRGAALSDAMRRRWRYAMIDEFQDTDETQWAIFRQAFFESRGTEPPGVVVLVGDPKQSVYRFRGADVETYLEAHRAVVAGGGREVRLGQNFRATPLLVDATNAIFDAAATSPVFTGEIAYAPVSSGRPDRTLTDGNGEPVSPVHVVRYRGSLPLAAFAEFAAREVLAMTDPRRPFRLDGRPLVLSDVFFLTRSGGEGRVVGNALRRAGVVHSFYKQDGLFASDEATDIRVLLAAIADPSNRSRRLAAWMGPFFGLPIEEVERSRELPDSHALVERLFRWKALADERDFERLFDSIVRDSGIVRRELFFGDGERSLTNTVHIFELLLDRARASHKTLSELVIDLSVLISRPPSPSDIEGVQRLESDRPAVQIMTIHKAKGLEAPVVFIAGGTSAPSNNDVYIFHEGGRRLSWVGPPAARVKGAIDAAERQENERLMYVALTRAMGRIVLPCVVDEGPRPRGLRGVQPEALVAKRLRGPYDIINRRLFALLAERRTGFTCEDAPPGRSGDAPPGTSAAHGEAASAERWEPPQGLLTEEAASGRFDALRAGHSGPMLTSYTRMQGRRGAGHLPPVRAATGGEAPGSDEPSVLHIEAEGRLRGARSSGIFLHEVLERAPLDSFSASPTFDAWRTRADVRSLFDEATSVHGIEPSHRSHGERMVWSAYTTAVRLRTGQTLAGLAFAARAVREMPFVFATGSEAPFAYVRGALDLTFEVDSRVYFVDWKSDSLPSYAPEAVRRHVIEHYNEQVKLYSIALVKLLGLETESEYEARFGGLFFWFLRGADPDGRGIDASRPSWAQIERWAHELRGGRGWATESSR